MERARIHEGIRRMRFADVVGRSERSELSPLEAAALLGISERTFRRWRDRHRDAGLEGLADRRLGPSLRRASVLEIERMLGLYRDVYRGFTVKHFHEQLGKRHNYTLGYTVTKLHLHRAGLLQRATTRSAHRKKRPRRPMVGMMLHQDASTHAWLPGVARRHDLVVTMEDATSELYSAFLVDQEGTASSFRGLGEVVARHGLFCSLYTDRGSHYFFTPEGGGKVSKTVLTQVGRGLKQLGIEHRGLLAASPWAIGAGVRNAAGSSAERAEAGRDRQPRGGQSLALRVPHRRPQQAVRGDRRADGYGVRGRRLGCLAGDLVHPGGSHSGQRQHGEVGRPAPATAVEPAANALRQNNRSGASVSGWPIGGVLGAPPVGRL
jgi:transposase